MYGQADCEGRPRTPLLASRRAVARGVRYRRRRRRRRCLISQLRANGGANGRSIPAAYAPGRGSPLPHPPQAALPSMQHVCRCFVVMPLRGFRCRCRKLHGMHEYSRLIAGCTTRCRASWASSSHSLPSLYASCPCLPFEHVQPSAFAATTCRPIPICADECRLLHSHIRAQVVTHDLAADWGHHSVLEVAPFPLRSPPVL